jgi:lipoprotein-anchoring transpeptidase ErfK/SrfK
VPTRIGTTDPWIEVNKTKQVLLFCQNGAVLYTIPVSTGSASVGMITPSGTFSIISKTPPRGHLYYPMAITSGIAIHGYPNVPTYPASHGCVRTQDWDQDVLYPITPMHTRVYIYT